MKRPKLPKKVRFVDENGVILKEKEAWESLCQANQEITLRILISIKAKKDQREYRLRRGEVVRILYGKNLENYQSFEESFEEDLLEFVHAAILWAREEQLIKERRAIAWRRLRNFPEANRVMKPTRFPRSPGQSRLF